MLQAYLNYPNSKVTVHGEASCRNIRQTRKPAQRHIHIDRESLEAELARFRGEHGFGSTAAQNDMWVTVDLADPQEEGRVLGRIRKMLGNRYKPFHDAQVERHC